MIPDDLNFFRDHFDGRSLSPAEWSPPPITISGKSKKLADVVGWMESAPIVSDRMKAVLEPIAWDCVQFLPFHQLRNANFHAMNVTCIERDLLDLTKSKIFYGDKDATALDLDRTVFREAMHEPPPIFKLAIGSGRVFSQIFVTKKFADVAIQHKLTGFELADPGEDSRDYVLAGKSQNVVPGIVG